MSSRLVAWCLVLLAAFVQSTAIRAADQKLEPLKSAPTGLSAEVAEEGKNLLSRMPRLAAHRELRKKYQDLVDGKLDVKDFTKARKKILAGLNHPPSAASAWSRLP